MKVKMFIFNPIGANSLSINFTCAKQLSRELRGKHSWQRCFAQVFDNNLNRFKPKIFFKGNLEERLMPAIFEDEGGSG